MERNLQRDKLNFGNGKIGVLFRAMFFPTLIAMIFNSALTVIDGIFVGHGAGADGIAAVNIVAPIFMFATGIGLMFGIGSSVVASIRLAENNVKAARIIMTQAFIVGLVIIGLICTLSLVFPDSLLELLGCSESLKDNALDYLLWLVPGLLFLYMECVGMMLIRLDGSPKFAMLVQIVAAVVNIGLDWYMIFPLEWGVMGAALATSIACASGGMMVLVYFSWFHDKLRFYRLKMSVTSMFLTLRNTGYMTKIGFATFLTELAMGVMMMTGNYMFIRYLGENGVAAYAVACYLFPLVFSISNAVAQSAQPIISFNHGLHDGGRVNRTLRISLFTAIVCGIVVTLCLWLGAPWVTEMFLSPDEAAYNLAANGLPLFSTCAMFFAVNIAFIGYYQSIERAGVSMAYTLLRGIVFLVPCFLLLPRLMGDSGLWLAIPAAELLTCIVICTRYAVRNRR